MSAYYQKKQALLSNPRRPNNAVLMLAQRLRRCANIKTALGTHYIFLLRSFQLSCFSVILDVWTALSA